MMEHHSNGVRYVVEVAGRDELKALHEFCTRMVPGGFADFGKWLERYGWNPNIFYVVKAHDEVSPPESARMVGAFAITPLSGRARELLDGELLKGVDFTSEHIARPGDSPAAMYISGIVASGFTAKGVTLKFLLDVMESEAGCGRCLFYTRPMSRAGLRLVTTYGFEPIDPAARGHVDRIYRKEVDAPAAPSGDELSSATPTL